MRPSPLRLMDHREFPLLYVDDEPDNLRIFELTFRRDFKIFTASSAEEGLEILNQNPIAIVLSDHRMPGMMGVEFLARVRAIDPKTIRMLVTAYGDAETLGVAINDGSIYRYIPKPWNPDDLRLTLRRGIETYALDRERDALIGELTQLNQLSRALHRELDLQRVIDLLLHTTVDELGFDGAALLFFDAVGDTLEWAGVAPQDEVAKAIECLSINRGNAREFIEELELAVTQVLRVDQIESLPRVVRDWLTEVSAEEILAVPLVGANGVIGIMAVDNRRGGRRFGADDQTLLDGVATQAVVAIENARIVKALRSAQRQIQRADRLGTLGTLAAGLAHEINNPLVSIQTFVSMAPSKRADADDSEFWQDYHQLACSEIERIRELVLTMSRLAHGGDEQGTPSEISLSGLVDEVVLLLQPEMQEAGIELQLDAGSRDLKVYGIRPHLNQVLLNLLCNAIAATPQGGKIIVRLAPDPTAEQETVCLTVEDSGDGIPEENLERIFDPFFTTKDPDQGTGLGLMITYRIVNDHGGSIEVMGSPGHGASFLVRLPVKQQGA
ncbi:MAG: two-component system NtrC family sensor kinase [Myxococcota bacterium]|jgi:two-component system NtrC family sensor kinase